MNPFQKPEVNPGRHLPFLYAKQRSKTFLLEMAVIREDIRQSFAAHRLHRNAIDQTISFVGPFLIKPQSGTERFPALWNNPHHGTCEQALDSYRGAAAKRLGRCRKESQIFGQHLIRCDDGRGCLAGRECQSLLMGAVSGIRKSNPVKGVGENRRHASFFGQP